MAQVTNEVVLSSSAIPGITQDVFGVQNNIKPDNRFNQAFVKQSSSSSLPTFYVLYSTSSFGDGDVGDTKLVPPNPLSASSESVTTNFIIQSVRGFDVKHNGIVLFSHVDYRGNAIQFTTDQPDTGKSFPPGEWEGASSLIITQGKWELYTQKDYNGAKMTVDSESQPLYRSLPLGDRIQSVRLVQS